MAENNTTEFVEEENLQVFNPQAPARQIDLNAEMSASTNFFCTIPETDKDYEFKVLDIMGEPDNRLVDEVNLTFKIDHVYAEVVSLPRDDGSGYEDVPRIIIQDTEGVKHGCASFGVLSFIKRLMYVKKGKITGTKVKVVQVTSRNGNRPLSLQVVK